MSSTTDENHFESTKMTFGEHLDELRAALIKSVTALVVGFVVALYFSGPMVEYVQTPLREALEKYYVNKSAEDYREEVARLRAEGAPVPADVDAAAGAFAAEGLVVEEQFVDPREMLDVLADALPEAVNREAIEPRDPNQPPTRDQLVPLRFYHTIENDPRVRVIGLSVQEPFTVYMKAALVLGAVFASPFIFYFIWQFVAAGLYPHEQRYIYIFLPVSLALFLAGAALAFFVAFGFVLRFLFLFNDWMGIDPYPRIGDWLSFVLILPLGFGIGFQLPLVMLFLERIGIFTVADYIRRWRISVLVIAVLSMILTPADPQSMILMGVPLVALYFGGILLCHLMRKKETGGQRSEVGEGE